MLLAGVFMILGAILVIVGIAIYQLFRLGVKMHTKSKSTYRAFSSRVLGGNKPWYEAMAMTDDHPDHHHDDVPARRAWYRYTGS